MTLNESDASQSITWLRFKSLNEHFSVHYLDNAHSLKTNGCFGWVAVNYLNASFVCITGLVSALGQCSNGLQLVHYLTLDRYYIALVH